MRYNEKDDLIGAPSALNGYILSAVSQLWANLNMYYNRLA
jgi:hypothetical protein